MEGKLERSGDAFAVRLSAEEVRSPGLSEGETVAVRAKDWSATTTEAEPQAQVRRYVNGIPVFTMAETVAEALRLGPAFEPPAVDRGPDRGSEIIDDDDPR